MTAGKCLLAAAAAAAVVIGGLSAGCGNDVSARRDVAEPQTIRLDWQHTEGSPNAFFSIGVRRLRIRLVGWSVEASVANRTPVTYFVDRPHVPGGTKFGLFLLSSADRRSIEELERTRTTTPPLLATSFRPPLPRFFHPGTRWSGTFSGPGSIDRDRYIRIAFGRFVTNAVVPAGLYSAMVFVTDQTVRLADAQGS